MIADDAVTSAKIADNAILTQHIDDNQITTDQIAANTIATGNIADNAVDGSKIAQNSILTRHIDDAQVNTAQLAGNSVTAAKIQANAVGSSEIAANAVSASELKSDALSGQTFTGTVTVPIIVASTRMNTQKLGIQDGDPVQKLHIDEVAGFDVGTASSTATTVFSLDTFSASVFRSAEYTVQITNSTDSDYQTLKISLFHDGSTVYLTQYASIFDNGAQATFDADISSGNVRLRVTPASGDTMAYKFIRTTIEV